tara:strand:- start:430 stop:1758 length:1329 start_codon:yes stop_codon:yes gene_type:complete
MTSRNISIRPNNIPSDGKISFKNGFPVLSFTIQAQNGILDPRTIRINGQIDIFRDNASPPVAPLVNASNQPTMDNRLGIYNIWDQLIIRHDRSSQICEHIRHYPRYMSSYLGVASSKQDLMTHQNESNLIMPNASQFFEQVVCQNASGSKVSEFSCNLPSGFMSAGNAINLMNNAFGSITIELHLTPDQQALFGYNGTTDNVISESHYQLSKLSLTCIVDDIPEDQMAKMQSETQGTLQFNTITSLYTTINQSNAQLQYSLGLKNVQSVFMNFVPSKNLNTLTANGHATTYPSLSTGVLANFDRVQFLRGGEKYPLHFDVTTQISKTDGSKVVDPELLRYFVESILPEYATDRSTVSTQNNNRLYTVNNTAATTYLDVADGGALFGIGMKYSQYNTGQDFSRQQWGVSLETTLTDDSPQSVFIYIKSLATLVWNANGIQLIQ